MKVVIFGSRTASKEDVFLAIKAFKAATGIQTTEVVCGCAKGADTFGAEFARAAGIPVKEFPADWEAHSKKAGILRNCDMAEYAEVGIAVWDGESHGTKHMIEEMKRLGKKVYIHMFVREN